MKISVSGEIIMHEYSLAMDMMEAILQAAEENNAKKVNSVTISVGMLAHVSPVQLEFCLNSLAQGTPAENASYIFEQIEPTVKCECGYAGKAFEETEDPEKDSYDRLAQLSAMVCPVCGKRLSIAGGQELFVDSIDID